MTLVTIVLAVPQPKEQLSETLFCFNSGSSSRLGDRGGGLVH